MGAPPQLGWLLPHHAGRGWSARRGQLERLDGPLYGLSALGVPETLLSASGGAFTAKAFEAMWARLQIRHETIETGFSV